MIKPLTAFPSVLAMLFCLQGCEKAQDTYLQIQMCLIDRQGVAQFKSIMDSIAAEDGLKFVDGSLETGRQLKATGADKSLKRDSALAINVGIEGKGHNFVLGGNLGLPPYQIALGFGPGFDPDKAHRLSDRLIERFSKRWHVETVPLDKGVQPMQTCGG
jgi:hypothetical protein